MRFSNLVVTGAGGGIGSAIVRRLAQDCDCITLFYNKSEKESLSLKDELSGITETVLIQCDLSNPSEAEQAFAGISKKNPVDALVNNAGISIISLLQDMSLTDIIRILNVNLTAAILAVRAFAPGMIKNKFGRIVNISSIWGECGASCEAVYSASKAGLLGFTEAMARELGPSGIRVNSVCPGMTETKMNNSFSGDELSDIVKEIPLGRIADPCEIAECVNFLLSDKSSYINGQRISPNGGMLI